MSEHDEQQYDDEIEEPSFGVHHDEEEHEEGEPWLVSYADMMTLLFGFFVLLYSFTLAKLEDQDHETMVKMRKEVAAFFGGEFIMPFQDEADALKRALAEEGGTNLEVRHNPEGVEIILSSTTLFDSGQADLKAGAIKALQTFAEVVAKQEEDLELRVEGHTDDVPVSAANRLRNNWELSGARAAAVISVFEKEGLPSRLMTAIGFADSRPLVPNLDAEGNPIAINRAKNRRVRIVVKSASPYAAQPVGPAGVTMPDEATKPAGEEPSEATDQ